MLRGSLPTAGGASPHAQGAWTVVASPSGSEGNTELHAVASGSANDVWAVGEADNSLGNNEPLILHWDGTAWSIVPSPSLSAGGVRDDFIATAAVSTNDVWAMGLIGSGTLIEQWNGTNWSVVPQSEPGLRLYSR